MKRRSLILAAVGLPFAAATAAGQPFRVSLIGGEYTGALWRAGVLIELDEGWKTYWRMPGEAGIPPEFSWTRSRNLASAEVLYPVPERFRDAGGETVGFKHEVVFPVLIEAADAARPVQLELDFFFATCKDVCIPGEARAALELGFSSGDAALLRLVAEWFERVPLPAKGAVLRASLDGSALLLALAAPADDIFVESATLAYFRAPEFSAGGRLARLAIDGLTEAAVLKGAQLRITLRRGEGGLEQTVAVE